MITLTAKEAEEVFDRLIDLARTKPVIVAKHGRAVVGGDGGREIRAPQALYGGKDKGGKVRMMARDRPEQNSDGAASAPPARDNGAMTGGKFETLMCPVVDNLWASPESSDYEHVAPSLILARSMATGSSGWPRMPTSYRDAADVRYVGLLPLGRQ